MSSTGVERDDAADTSCGSSRATPAVLAAGSWRMARVDPGSAAAHIPAAQGRRLTCVEERSQTARMAAEKVGARRTEPTQSFHRRPNVVGASERANSRQAPAASLRQSHRLQPQPQATNPASAAEGAGAIATGAGGRSDTRRRPPPSTRAAFASRSPRSQCTPARSRMGRSAPHARPSSALPGARPRASTRPSPSHAPAP